MNNPCPVTSNTLTGNPGLRGMTLYPWLQKNESTGKVLLGRQRGVGTAKEGDSETFAS